MKTTKQKIELKVEYRGSPKEFEKLFKKRGSLKTYSSKIITSTTIVEKSIQSEESKEVGIIFQYIKESMIKNGWKYQNTNDIKEKEFGIYRRVVKSTYYPITLKLPKLWISIKIEDNKIILTKNFNDKKELIINDPKFVGKLEGIINHLLGIET